MVHNAHLMFMRVCPVPVLSSMFIAGKQMDVLLVCSMKGCFSAAMIPHLGRPSLQV